MEHPMNRCYPHPLVAREGWHIIAALAAATIAALLWGSLKVNLSSKTK